MGAPPLMEAESDELKGAVRKSAGNVAEVSKSNQMPNQIVDGFRWIGKQFKIAQEPSLSIAWFLFSGQHRADQWLLAMGQAGASSITGRQIGWWMLVICQFVG